MTVPPISRRHLLAAAACAVVPGCSVLPNPPAPQIYRLSPQGDDPPDGPPLHGQLAIDLPTAPQSLDTDRIALTLGATKFDYYADASWTDRVPVLLQNLLVEAFENNSRITDVVRAMDSVNPTYLLETDIRDFEARYPDPTQGPPAVVLSLEFRMVKMPDRRTIGHILITEQASAARNKLDGIVAAFDVAVGKALDQSVPWALRTIGRS